MERVALGLPGFGYTPPPTGLSGSGCGAIAPSPSDHTDTSDRPALPGLLDRFGRVATDLRVSLTDHCNLRCTYCMPAEGLDWLPSERVLTDAELIRLITIGVEHLGINEIRFTGGEPLLRQRLESIIAAAAALTPRPQLSMTTNGLGLKHRAQRLADAGLDRINVSLDTLSAATFTQLTRRNRHDDVLQALTAARAAGFAPIKVNAVLIRGVNDHEAADLLDFCLAHRYQLRFIEQMPLDAQHQWNRTEMITADEIFTRLSDRFTLTPNALPRSGAPAELFDVDGGPGTVGIIASVTRPFCGDCDRTRLTADGQIRNCLFANTETDLLGLLRGGAADADIADRWRAAMWGKFAGHGINDESFLQPERPMSSIGG